mmetsp:Transcript_56947/g.119050  ORF Transcript_56947/g.119050 Transcript_56947/m.119050 type:complete len:359 (+) Transcript_56947:309-1385(+)
MCTGSPSCRSYGRERRAGGGPESSERLAEDGEAGGLHDDGHDGLHWRGAWQRDELVAREQHRQHHGRLLHRELLADAVARAGDEGDEGVRPPPPHLLRVRGQQPPPGAEGVRRGEDGGVAVRGVDGEVQRRPHRHPQPRHLEVGAAIHARDRKHRGPEAQGLLEGGGDALEALDGVEPHPAHRARPQHRGHLRAQQRLLRRAAGELVRGEGEQAAGGVLAREEEGEALVGDRARRAAAQDELVRQVHSQVDGELRPAARGGTAGGCGGGGLLLISDGLEHKLLCDVAALEVLAATLQIPADFPAHQHHVDAGRSGEVADVVRQEYSDQALDPNEGENIVPGNLHPFLVEFAGKGVIDD